MLIISCYQPSKFYSIISASDKLQKVDEKLVWKSKNSEGGGTQSLFIAIFWDSVPLATHNLTTVYDTLLAKTMIQYTNLGMYHFDVELQIDTDDGAKFY